MRTRYGAGPVHLLAMVGCFALAAYAGVRLLDARPLAVAIWFTAAVVAHDLVLFPLYTLADRSAQAVLRRRAPAPTLWINHLRVPVLLSGLLLLVWFPLIFQLSGFYTAVTALPAEVYLGRWLLVTGVLFTGSAAILAGRLLRARPARDIGGRGPTGAGHDVRRGRSPS
ncbi:hypothetical protein GCM10017691_11250 [Pseudonocardia petroleophila]|uniref:Lipoprotein n=1 Tax=Pseudonocardia petroleophila TaxID=37331 RepID=A0A7G7MIW4_9PSEU|nr:hypothetical protein [Pseudonocardia petroleophila]QNG52725.1 hypothetical protein H6H00_01225 [Pseudonocardia petroleophila]